MAHTTELTDFILDVDIWGTATLQAKNKKITPIEVEDPESAERNRRVFHKREVIAALHEYIELLNQKVKSSFIPDRQDRKRNEYLAGLKKTREVLFKLPEPREADALQYIILTFSYVTGRCKDHDADKRFSQYQKLFNKYYDLYLKEYESINDKFLAQ